MGPSGESAIMLLCQDVTDRVEAEQARERALCQAEEALAVRERFLATAAHELRTPLTSLKGNLQLLRLRLARGAAREELGQYGSRAEQQVDRLTKLVSDLLDVSRIAGGRLALEREPVTIVPLVQRAVEHAQMVTRPPRSIMVHAPDRSPVVLGDAERLEQVFLNLLDNACKYSPADTPIDVHITTTDDVVEVAVQDQGIGIPLEDQPRIFERFHRAGNIDPGVSGFGLGLHIVHEIVAAHGGKITLVSAPGAGSTFTVTLPLG